ncbi:MAG: cyclic nucleotide-binding domain-containing protein [bacterium]|nr:cyclic nucleotide-binding domain-containing protein [bacterium]
MNMPPDRKTTHANPPSASFKLTREGAPPIEDLISKLQNHYEFFREMDTSEILRFFRLCGRKSYHQDEIIFEEGDPGDTFYLIVSGEVRISLRGKEISRLGIGHFFGEMSILDDSPRSATVTAAKSTLVLAVDPGILSGIMPSFGFKVALHLARNLSQKLRETDNKLQN